MWLLSLKGIDWLVGVSCGCGRIGADAQMVPAEIFWNEAPSTAPRWVYTAHSVLMCLPDSLNSPSASFITPQTQCLLGVLFRS